MIRVMVLEELPTLLVWLSSLPEAPVWPRAAWESFVHSSTDGDAMQRLLMAAWAGEELLGVLAATLLQGTAELESLLVKPGARRTGLGRALSTEWLTWAETHGATEAVLEVRASNVAAQALYEGLGFATGGRRTAYYRGPREDALLMRKVLASDR